jgi:Domain of unknown function (DUF1508)
VIEFQLHRAVNGQDYCRIVASNGEVLFTSETYPNKRDSCTRPTWCGRTPRARRSSTTLRSRHERILCRLPTPARRAIANGAILAFVG